MISKEDFKRFALPALIEEWEFLEHTIYHFDGVNALHHMDTILSCPQVDAIQWVPGAGNKPQYEWIDLLKKIQHSGKAVEISGVTPEQAKKLHRELKPNLVYYRIYANTPQEADSLIKWFEKNT